MILNAVETTQFERLLQAREQQLLSELHAGKQRASAETFERVAGEAPDTGDSSIADATADGISAERERDMDELREVQDALGRIERGTYGLCMRCGEPIEPQRLRALPTARYDLPHQEEQDRQRGRVATPTL
jgi:DnaK suppressor protein